MDGTTTHVEICLTWPQCRDGVLPLGPLLGCAHIDWMGWMRPAPTCCVLDTVGIDLPDACGGIREIIRPDAKREKRRVLQRGLQPPRLSPGLMGKDEEQA